MCNFYSLFVYGLSLRQVFLLFLQRIYGVTEPVVFLPHLNLQLVVSYGLDDVFQGILVVLQAVLLYQIII